MMITETNGSWQLNTRIDRVDIATALQAAQKNIMKRKDIDYYLHPYYWAPFVLEGLGMRLHLLFDQSRIDNLPLIVISFVEIISHSQSFAMIIT